MGIFLGVCYNFILLRYYIPDMLGHGIDMVLQTIIFIKPHIY